MKKGNVALFGWLLLFYLPTAERRVRGIEFNTYDEMTVGFFLLCFILSLACCYWGAWKKYSYFYTADIECFNNRIVEFVLHYYYAIVRAAVTVFFMFIIALYFVRSQYLSFFILIIWIIFTVVLARWATKKLQLLSGKTGAESIFAPYSIKEFLPLWAIVSVFIVSTLIIICINLCQKLG